MTDLDSYYVRVDEFEFDSTVATQSPWDVTAQHGGPPAALLANVMQATTDDPQMTLARMSVDMLGRIPQGRMRVEAEVVRPGKRVEMVTGALFANESLAVTATGWRIREPEGATAEHADPAPDLPARPGAEAAIRSYFEGVSDQWGYGRSIEWRFVEGGFEGQGIAKVWAKVLIPLISGEEISGMERLLVVADSANGLSMRLPLDAWWSIPPTMTATIQGTPSGQWLFVDAITHLGDSGRGLAEAKIYDEAALRAAVTQPLMVTPR